VHTTPGSPTPLGATPDATGTNFAVFSANAEALELCLYDDANQETARLPIGDCTGDVWHIHVAGVRPGQRYGFRAYGPWNPAQGLRFNPHKLLSDPYARVLVGEATWNDAWQGHQGSDDMCMDTRDSAPFLPRSAVVDGRFDWAGDQAPGIPWRDTIIYELHVKGFTMRHPGVPQHLRGTYAGLASPAALEHLTGLGVTAVELMPVHHCISEPWLLSRGFSNYWGYNTIGYFAPDTRFAATGDAVTEFKQMVRALHAAGIEVILDVVYNHTAEGNQLGPTLCFRGLDNPSYYRLAEEPRYYQDYTGCGNTLNMMHPRALGLMLDSLRYWVLDMHVDGFRFDLAAALARELNDVNRLGAFFDAIEQDDVVSKVKLIAEPWDVGEGGYQVGNFPRLWAEWNGVYRDTVRAFWRGDEGQAGSFAYRLTGSSDLYGKGGRRPYASVNYVTAHDGFTLRDLVSYNDRHNEANGENNQDGDKNNHSWNCGVEGPTDDPAVTTLRTRLQRNFLATLLLSLGVPMITAGDEINRTQQGNNNAYCQDNELSWLDWTLDDGARALLAFTRDLIALRKAQPVLRREQFLQGRLLHGAEVKDLSWFRPDGREMSDQDWASYTRCLGLRLAGDALEETDERGGRIRGDTLLILVNADAEPRPFVLPAHKAGLKWEPLLDTRPEPMEGHIKGGATFELDGRSLAVFRLVDKSKGDG
jgi:isoamylase